AREEASPWVLSSASLCGRVSGAGKPTVASEGSPVMAATDTEWSMIESIEFANFKALRKATLPLAPFTLLLRPNGSGKPPVLQALQGIAAIAAQQAGIPRPPPAQAAMAWSSLLSVTAEDRRAEVQVKLRLRLGTHLVIATFQWHPTGQVSLPF